MKELLRKLADEYGPSGREEDVADIIKSELEDYADNIETDSFGNVISTRNGSSDFSIMLAAHSDEIGLAVEKISEDGFAFPSRVGGWDPRILPSSPMNGKNAWGLISTSPIGLLSKDEKKKSVGHNDLFIETHNISTGSFLVNDVKMKELGNPNVIVGKSLDDRAGLTVMIEAFKRISDFEPNIHAVATVQEEVGLRGAGVAAYKLNPDLGIVLEVALADDVPSGRPYTPVISLGKGPAITVKDASVISHPKLTDFMIKVAEDEDIPYQLELLERGGTDAGRIHLTREGIPSSVIGVPTRYLHSPIEVLDIRDLEHAIDLLVSILETIKKPIFKSFL